MKEKTNKRGRPSQNLVSVHYKVSKQTADTINELSNEMKIARGKVVDLSVYKLKVEFDKMK